MINYKKSNLKIWRAINFQILGNIVASHEALSNFIATDEQRMWAGKRVPLFVDLNLNLNNLMLIKHADACLISLALEDYNLLL